MSVTTLNRFIGGIALIALSGCAAPSPPQQPASQPSAQTMASSGPIALVPPPSTVPAKPAPAKRREDRKATTASVTVPAPPPAAPVHLVGMDETAVQALLGTPSLVEDHAPGKTWRFRKHDCVLSVALYPDVQTRVFRTLSYEVTSDEHNTGAKQLCETKFGSVALAE